MERHERLKWARERRGFRSAAEAARYLGVPYGTYSGHENGQRGIKDSELAQYAGAFKVSLAWLAYGEGPPAANSTAPLVGIVGAGAEIYPIDDFEKGGGLDEVEAPFSDAGSLVAVEVRGDSMWPAYHEGDFIFYRDRHDADLEGLVGRECIVRLADGRTFIKTIERGSNPGFWTLISYNAPPLRDVVVEWAARVRHVTKR